jgi:hypothetical protein
MTTKVERRLKKRVKRTARQVYTLARRGRRDDAAVLLAWVIGSHVPDVSAHQVEPLVPSMVLDHLAELLLGKEERAS